jgi:hypothetical protein
MAPRETISMARKSRSRPPFRRFLLFVEALEDRTVPSTLDGSFQAIHLTDLRNDPNLSFLNGKGVGIANLDTGVYGQNPDIQPNLAAWYDAVGVLEGSPSAQPIDPDGHGTHTAGIEAASDPTYGVAPGASLIGVRALPTDGYDTGLGLYQDSVAQALQWVLDNHQKYNILVVNMSLGNGTNYNSPQPIYSGEPTLINELEQAGVTVVAASGNSYGQYIAPGESSPAIYATLGVANSWGAVGDRSIPPQDQQVLGGSTYDSYFTVEKAGITDTLAATSQRSTMANQVAAPGSGIYNDNGTLDLGILSTWNQPNKLFNIDSGTSMAAPMVSGVVALMQQAAITYGGHALAPDQVRAILQSTADTIVDTSNPNDFRVPIVNGTADTLDETPLPGTGLLFKRINAHAAVQEVIREVSAPSSGGGTTSTDTDATTATADVLAAIDGTAPALTVTGNIGSDGRVQVGPNDVDLYKVTLASPGTFSAALGAVSGGQNFTAELRVFDQGGNELGASTGDASNGYPSLQGALSAGTYYVGVSSAGNSVYHIADDSGAAGGQTTGDYTLTLSLSNPDPNGVISGAVPFAGIPNVFHGVIGSDPDPNNPFGRIQIGPGDVDMFQVVAPDTGNLQVDVNTAVYGLLAVFGGQALDSYVRVFDAQGNELGSQAAFGFSDNAFTLAMTRGETVYLGVSDSANEIYDPNSPYNRNANGFGGAYDLTLTFDNGDRNGTIFTASAFNIGDTIQGSVGSDVVGQVVGADGSKDVDFEKYTPGQDGVLDVKVSSRTTGFTPVVSLWTYSPGSITTAQLAIEVADTSSTESSEILYQVHGGQSYYVAVTGLGNTDFQWYATASGTGGETGQYQLTTALQPLSTMAQLSNDSMADGGIQTIAVGQSIAGNIGMDGNLVVGPADVDLYRFVAPASETIDVRTLTTAEGSADTFLRVFDANGRELAYNDNASPNTTGSEVRLTVQAGQTYYFGINGAIGTDGTDQHARDYNPLTGTGAAPSTSLGNYILSVSAVSTATQLVVTTPPGSVVAGNGFGFVVQAEDGSGNLDPHYTGSVTVTLASGPIGANLGGTLTMTAVGGVATFSGLTLDVAGTGYTLHANASGLAAATTGSFLVTAGSATRLVVTRQPPASVTAGAGFALTIQAEDALGNLDPTFGGSVTLAIANNPAGGTLAGTLTVTAGGGVAAFSGLTLDRAGTGYTLQATAGGLSAGTTEAFNVTAGTATQLVVTAQPPAGVTAGSGFGLTVQAEDSSGNVDPTFKGSVTVALGNNPGGGALGGTLTMTASGGVAAFSGLTLGKTATGYTLEATSGGLTAATTNPFHVTAGPATYLVVTAQPPATASAGAGFGLAVQAEDIAGNIDSTFTGNVTVALAANPGGSTLGGTLTVTAVNGVATFTNLTLNRPGTGYTLRVSAGSLAAATSGALSVTSNPPPPPPVISEPTNITALVSVLAGALVPVGKHRPKAGGRFQQTVTITNNSADVVDGPLMLVLDSLAPRKKVHKRLLVLVTLLNASGHTQSVSPGSPFVRDSAGLSVLPPGGQATFALSFQTQAPGAVTFRPIVLAGYVQP